jgi:hypothetical protein
MRTNRFLPFLLLVLLAILPACSANRTLLTAPQPTEAPFRGELQPELSSISVSFETGADDLARILNQTVAKELYRGEVKGSGVTATVRRGGQISTAMNGDYIHIGVPVTVSLSYSFFKTPDMATKLKFKVRPAITPDWKIAADVQYTGLEDVLADEIGIGPVKLKPRSTVEGAIQPLQKTLGSLVSRQINEQFPLRPRLEKAWSAAQKPVLLDKKYRAWLKLTPKQVMLTPLKTDRNRARVNMGISTLAEVSVGPEPAAATPLPLPPLKNVTDLDRNFRVSVKTELLYKEIVAILSPLLLGKDFGSDGRSVVLKDFALSGNGERIVVRLETTGDLAGTFYLTGKPAFNPATNRFSVDEVDFDMNTQSLLLTSADWFLHGTIQEKIQEKLNLDLTTRLADAKEMAHKALSRVELADHVVMQGAVRDLRFNDVLVQKDRITLQLYAEGETAMVLQ